MKMDISIRLAVAAVASVFLLTSCPSPTVKPVEPPAPEYKVQYSYLKADGTASATPTDIRLYSTTKDGVAQTGYAVAQLTQPGIYSILFTDNIADNNADYLQLFFVSGADLPFRMVNRFTTTDEAGQKKQETVVGIPSRYDNATQSFDVTFSSIENRSDTMTLQDVVLNKEIFNLKDHGPRLDVQPLVVSKASASSDGKRSDWSYMDYLLIAGACVAYAMQDCMQPEAPVWSGCPVAAESFASAIAGNPKTLVTASVPLHSKVITVVSYEPGTVGEVGQVQLGADKKYDLDSRQEAPVILIWEVDGNGEPLDVPNSKIGNNGTVHLHPDTGDGKKEVILKIRTIHGTWSSVAIVKSMMVTDLGHKIEVSTDASFSTVLLDEKTNEASFYNELYVRITPWEKPLRPDELSSYIYLYFQGLPQGVYATINGEQAILNTRLEDTEGNLEPESRDYGNIFKVNICELASFHTNS